MAKYTYQSIKNKKLVVTLDEADPRRVRLEEMGWKVLKVEDTQADEPPTEQPDQPKAKGKSKNLKDGFREVFGAAGDQASEPPTEQMIEELINDAGEPDEKDE